MIIFSRSIWRLLSKCLMFSSSALIRCLSSSRLWFLSLSKAINKRRNPESLIFRYGILNSLINSSKLLRQMTTHLFKSYHITLRYRHQLTLNYVMSDRKYGNIYIYYSSCITSYINMSRCNVIASYHSVKSWHISL